MKVIVDPMCVDGILSTRKPTSDNDSCWKYNDHVWNALDFFRNINIYSKHTVFHQFY